jgi:lysophospholipase L1-like esterase
MQNFVNNTKAVRLIAAFCLFALLIALAAGCKVSQTSPAAESPAAPDTAGTPPPETPAASPEPTPTPTPSPEPEPTPTPYFFTDGHGSPVYGYEYGLPVPEADAVDAEYFTGTAFIGDSLTVGLRLYGDLKSADFLAAKSVTAVNIFTKEVINNAENSYITILEALKQKTYSKVYIMLGVNELGAKPEAFKADYAKVLSAIEEAQPNAAIYVQAMMPVTEYAKTSNGANFNNERITERNAELISLCKENGYFYIDTFAAFADETGALAEAGAADGVHLKPTQYAAWGEFLKSHTLEDCQ